MKTISNKYFYITLLSIIFIFYFLCLTPYVQGGDTAELVLAAKNLFVAHPPGYPLFIWLNFIWNKIFFISTDYFRASFLNIIFSLSTIIFLTKEHYQSRTKLIWLIAVYFFTIPIFEATILPDVFALHAFFIGWIFYSFRNYYSNNLEKLTYIGFPFFLGFTNHLTMILFSPLFITAFIKLYRDTYYRLRFIVRSIVAFILSLGIYLSIFFFNTKSYYSWGNIETLMDLIKHILRFDYGTFNFAPQASSSNIFSTYQFFITENYFTLLFLLIPIFLSIKTKEALKKYFPVLASSLLTVLFLATANFNLDSFGAEIILRFHTLPILALVFSLSILFEFQSNFSLNKLQNFILYIVVIFLFLRINPYLKMRNDSLMENYYKNVLATAIKSQSKIILTDNDSEYFGIRYFQKQNRFDDVAVISPPLFFHSWYLDKIKRANDYFQLPTAQKIVTTKNLDLEKDLILPNLSSTNIYVLKDFNNIDAYNITFHKLGRVISSKEKSSGQVIDLQYPFIGIQLAAPNNLFSKNYFLDNYAYYYINQAKSYYQVNDFRKALYYLKSALMVAPNNLKIKENICSIKKDEPVCRN